MFKWATVLAVLWVVTSISASLAGPSEDGLAAYRRNDYAAAKRLFQQGAKEGNADALFWLGAMNANGHGTPTNAKEAARLFRLAAAKDHARAQFVLGSQHFKGEGVPQNHKEAARLYQLAAEQGLAAAQQALGSSYFLGLGVPKNNVRGYMWMSLAGAQGMQRALAMRDDAVRMNKMTAREIAEAQEMVRSWKPRESRASQAVHKATAEKPAQGMKELVAWEKCLNDFAAATALKNPDTADMIVDAAMMVCIQEENRHFQSQKGLDPRWESFFQSNVFPDLKANLKKRVIARILLLRSSPISAPQHAPQQKGTL